MCEIEKLAHQAGAQTLEACMASSIPQAREGKLYLMCGGTEDAFRKAEPILKEIAFGSALHRQRWRSRKGEGARQHGDEHQHRRIGGGIGTRRGARSGFGNVEKGFFANRRGLPRAGNGRRRYAKSRARLLFLCGACCQR